MALSSSNHAFRAKSFQIVACPYCRLHFRFYRSIAPHVDECGFKSYSLECPRCDATLRGIIDPADDKLLLSGTEPQNTVKIIEGLKTPPNHFHQFCCCFFQSSCGQISGRLRGSVVIKSQLILRIAGQNPQLFQRDVEKMVSAVLDEIVAALAQGSRVELRGFGTFAVKVREGRVGRNPKTGATVHVPEKKIPVFRQGREIRKRLNPLATTPISPEQTSSV